jgi:hypothetical protein
MTAAEGDVPAIIVGGGRIGGLLASLGPSTVLKRDEPFPAEPTEGPIYVCTRNDALEGVIEMTPPHRREDLVFLQNGMLEDFLEGKGLADATQVLLYLAVTKAGAEPIDGITSENKEGLTAATGKWADAFTARLAAGGLTCKSLAGDAFTQAMLEKHVWICAFMLVGALNGGITVGETMVASRTTWDKEKQLSLIIAELCAAGEEALGVKLPPRTLERLLAYGRSVHFFPTAVKELEWRNGWFYKISQAAVAAGKPDPMPLHTAGLKKLKVVK